MMMSRIYIKQTLFPVSPIKTKIRFINNLINNFGRFQILQCIPIPLKFLNSNNNSNNNKDILNKILRVN
jgi:hypothetical protein